MCHSQRIYDHNQRQSYLSWLLAKLEAARVIPRSVDFAPFTRRRSQKNLAGEPQSAIVHCRPLLAIAAVASVAHLQKMPANSASLAC